MPDPPPEMTCTLVFVEITDATLKAVPGILDPSQDGYHDTDPDANEPAPTWDLFNTPITGPMFHRADELDS